MPAGDGGFAQALQMLDLPDDRSDVVDKYDRVFGITFRALRFACRQHACCAQRANQLHRRRYDKRHKAPWPIGGSARAKRETPQKKILNPRASGAGSREDLDPYSCARPRSGLWDD